jgi:hypothetical protein
MQPDLDRTYLSYATYSRVVPTFAHTDISRNSPDTKILWTSEVGMTQKLPSASVLHFPMTRVPQSQ